MERGMRDKYKGFGPSSVSPSYFDGFLFIPSVGCCFVWVQSVCLSLQSVAVLFGFSPSVYPFSRLFCLGSVGLFIPSVGCCFVWVQSVCLSLQSFVLFGFSPSVQSFGRLLFVWVQSVCLSLQSIAGLLGSVRLFNLSVDCCLFGFSPSVYPFSQFSAGPYLA